jgi:2-desacetyl-2-hydroxyethyl bacteriochlorophyllide A dehydrogenase
MRAARYTGPKTIEAADVAVCAPREGEVQLAVAYTGICGTDLHIYHGDMDGRVSRPAVIGHECSATIAAIGAGVEGWSVGDSVCVLPVRSCGVCAACLAGFGHVCPRLVFLGIDAAGAMQNRWNVPATLLVRVPSDVGLRHAALVEPTAVAVHDVRRAAVAAGHNVVVVGGGPVGMLIAVVARAAGADISLVEVDGDRRALAARLGFRVIDPATTEVASAIDELTSSRGADVAFEVSGSAGGVATAVDVLGVRGKLVMVAIHTQQREMNLHRFFWRELEMVGARLYERRDFEEAVRLIASGVVPADQLISAVVPLDEAGEAFASLDRGGVMKVLVDCTTASEEANRAV